MPRQTDDRSEGLTAYLTRDRGRRCYGQQVKRCLVFLILIITLLNYSQAQTPTNTSVYIYDERGRLTGVITPNGDVAIYAYDAAGNILSITRQQSSTVTIIEFTPNSGPVGTPVTIYGTGFSTTAGANTVTFNGAAATITSSSATQIVTTVPAEATTGPIAITTPTGLFTTSESFIVENALSITSFTPTIGTPGTAVQLTGTGFNPIASSNQVKFNLAAVAANSATATTIDTSVPNGATSGHISVTTPEGTAVSTGDFFVPPSPFTVAQVDFAQRMAIGETRTVLVNAANHIALIVFDGVAGRRVSLKTANSTISSSYVTIYNPDGSILLNHVFVSGSTLLDPVDLPVTGTYTILLDPNSTFTGAVSLTLLPVPPDATSGIEIGGPPVRVTITDPAQNAQLSFAGNAGQRVLLERIEDDLLDFYESGLDVINPDGSTLYADDLYTDVLTLPVTGTYTVRINPPGDSIGSMTLVLYEIPPNPTSTITAGGPPIRVTIPSYKQLAKVTFSGTAGQRVSLRMENDTIGPDFSDVDIYNPDGSYLTGDYAYPDTFLRLGWLDTSDRLVDTVTLPMTGTYTIIVGPYSGCCSGGLTLTLFNVPADVTYGITLDGTPVTVTTTVAGQDARLTFNATAGQRISLKATAISIVPYSYIEIYRPGGALLSGSGFYTFPEGAFKDYLTLPVTGTYTIVYDAYTPTPGSATFQLYSVPVDLTGTISPGGPPVTLTTTAPGQNANVTFSGTAGQRVSLKVTGTLPLESDIYINKPNGQQLTSTFVRQIASSRGAFVPTVTLPTTGTYTIKVRHVG